MKSRIALTLLCLLIAGCGGGEERAAAPDDTAPDHFPRIADQRGDTQYQPPQHHVVPVQPPQQGGYPTLQPGSELPPGTHQPTPLPTQAPAQPSDTIAPQPPVVAPVGPQSPEHLLPPQFQQGSIRPESAVPEPVPVPVTPTQPSVQYPETALPQPKALVAPTTPDVGQPVRPIVPQPAPGVQPTAPEATPRAAVRPHSIQIQPLTPRSAMLRGPVAEAEPTAPQAATAEPLAPRVAQPAEMAESAPQPVPQPVVPQPIMAAPPETAAPAEAAQPFAVESPGIAAMESAEPQPAAQPVGQPTAPTSSPAAPTSAAPPLSSSDNNKQFDTVRVFYGTDRGRLAVTAVDWTTYLRHYLPSVLVAIIAALLAAAAVLFVTRRKTLVVAATTCAVASVVLVFSGSSQVAQARRIADGQRVHYGVDRGQLELGTCDVSIPKSHQVGEIEAPSILRLELREDPTKHVVLAGVTSKDEADFYDELRQRVAASPRREVLVFVHGFNVTFDAAAKRTAQMAYDLEFAGAPVFFSWPSRGELLEYATDETNVAWSVPHLKQFLVEVATRSDANAVNLIAHSMGNRALTGALRELALELGGQQRLFNQVVLAAPDVDADVFRRDIAPAIARTAGRVTLYASSNDQALVASRKVHGYSRAGESGASLVVLPEIETIDVSEIDTSLLGHSYYGSSGSILSDVAVLLHQSLPAAQRTWLHQHEHNGLPYWVYHGEATVAHSHGATHPH